MSYTVTVDETKCIRCGACARECARHLPVYRDGGYGGYAGKGDEENEENRRNGQPKGQRRNRETGENGKRGENKSNGLDCVGCLHCFAVCPQGAVIVKGLEPVENGHERIDPTALFGLLARRRSYRRFEERGLDPRLLEELVRAAAYVPSGGNSHSHRLTVITAGQARQRLELELARIYRRRKALLGSAFLRSVFGLFADPQTRAFLRDRTYFTRVSYLMEQIARGEDPIFYNAPAVILVHSPKLIPTPREDSVLVAYNMVLTAETRGLGSCFVSLAQNAINTSRRCKRILGLDPQEQIYAVVVVGHPAVHFQRPVPRKPVPTHSLPEHVDPSEEVPAAWTR